MRILNDNGVYRASHITGPTHNFLALELEELPVGGDFPIDEQELPNEPRRVSADMVRTAIIEGVARANAELGTQYGVKRAQFVTGDTNNPLIYIHLAHGIVRFAHLGDWRYSAS